MATDAPELRFNCPACGREYSASQCSLYDPPRRPLYDGLQATVICAGRPDGSPCLSPDTGLRTQFEVVLRLRQFQEVPTLRDRLLRRRRTSRGWTAEVLTRSWR